MNVFIAGHTGMVGSAVYNFFTKSADCKIFACRRDDLDLRNSKDVYDYLVDNQISAVINCAAVVGGILANYEYPYSFLMDNMQIQNSLLSNSVKAGIRKFVFLGSSCIYPKMAPQPILENQLLTGSLEPTNQWYAIAKISGVKACEAIRLQLGYDYISVMPSNLYGPGDNFNLHASHVIPAMIRKFHNGKLSGEVVTLWGTGKVRREFLHVNDLARAIFQIFNLNLNYSLINVGAGYDITLFELSKIISKVVGYNGIVSWDSTKPDGTPRKLLDITRVTSLGWSPEFSLENGLIETYNWFLQNANSFRDKNIS